MAVTGEVVEFSGRGGAPAIPNLARLLRPSREGRGFSARPVSFDTLEELHALMAVGPGMAGASPTRVLFLSSPTAKAKLAPHLAPRTREAAVLAPVCAVIGYDRNFAEQLMAFVGDGVAGESCFDQPRILRAAAMRNGVLQGAYLTLSARALGLDAHFFHGYDGHAVAGAFFRDPGTSAIFAAALGYPRDE